MAWKASLAIGITCLVLGVLLFGENPTGTPQEKFGTIFMMYSGIFIGIAFTIYVTLKAQS